jgi:hypothetical protein
MRPRIRGPGCGWLVALRRPVLDVADRASSVAPIGVQLVKYVLHLLNGTGRPARRARCPDRERRGSGAGRPPWLWPPGRSPERNRGHRCQKDKGQRHVRRDQVLHNALPQLWKVTAGGARLTDGPSPARTPYGVRAPAPGPRVSACCGWLARDEPASRARASALARTTSGSRGPAGGPIPARRAGSLACRRGWASSPGQPPRREAGHGRSGLSLQALLRRCRR